MPHPKFWGVVSLRDWVERTQVPGAAASGLLGCTRVGPRLLVGSRPSGLSAIRSPWIGLARNSLGQMRPYEPTPSRFGRLFSLAPTVMQFLAAACEPICPAS